MLQIKVNNINELAVEHYDYLCNKFTFSISKRLDKSLSKYKSKRKDIYKLYFKLLEYLKNNLTEIIIGKPIILDKHKVKLSDLSESLNFDGNLKSKSIEETEILQDLKKIFKYSTFSSSGFQSGDIQYSGNVLVQKINLSTCPYCNRNTIYSIKKQRRTFDLDHFYPQSKYPFFALSFYNLIPSCKVCNQIKLDNDNKEYINPYDRRFNFNKNMKFNLKIEGATFGYSTDGFKICCKISNDMLHEEEQRIQNNIDDFELEDLYQNHKDIVLELIQKREIYSDSYIDELLREYEGSLFKNKEDLLRMITCGYVNDEDLDKRPLSKLIKDISEELEFI